MTERQQNVFLKGRPTSPGVVIGPAFVYRERLAEAPPPYDIQQHQVEDEVARVDRAMEGVQANLQVSARRIEKRVDAKLAAIFEAHGAILRDPVLRQEIRREVENELVNAEHALVHVLRRWERKFRGLAEEGLRQRADDIVDLGRRLLQEMAGVETTPLEKMPEGRILIARRLLPSDTVALPRRAVLGIVLEFGGPGSHAALLARGMGIPTVTLAPGAAEQIVDDEEVIVDGTDGDVIARPDAAMRERYARKSDAVQAPLSAARGRCHETAKTCDGTAIRVLANVGCREEAVAAAEYGADGVGLCRLEQFYLSRKVPPTADELLAELREMFAPLQGKPITIRLLDLGGDKPLPFLKLPIEDHPFLGRRGVRLLLRFPDLITTQLRALLEFARAQEVHILVPMVTLARDMAQIRERLTALAAETGRPAPPLGAMIETPAAALTVGDLRRHADFLSLGTNDLTQYTMAAGRENPLVAEYFQEDHPAVLRLVRMVVEEATGAPVEVCGELAGQLDAVPTLRKLGVRALSVAPPLVPSVKEAVRAVSL
jgi:phosphotransferase system enzyme I (PtsI)